MRQAESCTGSDSDCTYQQGSDASSAGTPDAECQLLGGYAVQHAETFESLGGDLVGETGSAACRDRREAMSNSASDEHFNRTGARTCDRVATSCVTPCPHADATPSAEGNNVLPVKKLEAASCSARENASQLAEGELHAPRRRAKQPPQAPPAIVFGFEALPAEIADEGGVLADVMVVRPSPNLAKPASHFERRVPSFGPGRSSLSSAKPPEKSEDVMNDLFGVREECLPRVPVPTVTLPCPADLCPMQGLGVDRRCVPSLVGQQFGVGVTCRVEASTSRSGLFCGTTKKRRSVDAENASSPVAAPSSELPASPKGPKSGGKFKLEAKLGPEVIIVSREVLPMCTQSFELEHDDMYSDLAVTSFSWSAGECAHQVDP